MITQEDTRFESLEEAAPDDVSPRSYEDIEALAYALWEARGCPEGSAEEDWLRAEQELSASK